MTSGSSVLLKTSLLLLERKEQGREQEWEQVQEQEQERG